MKTNMYGWNQERTLVITDKALYNIHKKKIKRVIHISDVGGITKTVPPSKNAQEFTVHVPSTYDYRFETTRREEIINVLKRVFYSIHKKNCPMFYVTTKNLNEYTTTEKDMKKMQSRMPTQNLRTHAEDLFQGDSSDSITNTENEAAENAFGSNDNDLKNQQALRGNQLR